MNDLSQFANSGQKPKFNWKKPEGIFGWGLVALGVSVVGYGLFLIIPPLFAFLLTSFQQGIAIILFGAIFLFLLAIVTNKQFILAMRTLVETIARRVSRAVIRSNPIGVANNFIAKTAEKLTEIDQGIQRLFGFIRKGKDKLAKAQGEFNENLTKARTARDVGKKSDMLLAVRRAGRREKRSVSLNEQIVRLERLLEIFTKYREALQLLHDDTKDEVEQVSAEWQEMKDANTLMHSMRALLNPDSDERQMFLDAMQFMMDDRSEKLGEIEGFFEMTKSVISSMDLDNLVIEEHGLSQLDTWEKKMEGLLTPGEHKLLGATTPTFSDVLLRDKGIPAPAELRQLTPRSGFGDLFETK